jgi:uncharacterized protein (TIGR03118 family)
MNFGLKTQCVAAAFALSMAVMPAQAQAQQYTQTNLVSDTGAGGTKKDPNLVNAWGLSRSSGSPWWVANNGSNTSTLYASDGTAIPLIVTVPGGPTGTIFNGTTDFILGGKPAAFVFAAEDGSISAWNGGAAATVVASKAAVYKGLALGSVNGANYLYATDFHNGKVDVLDTNFHYVTLEGHEYERPFHLEECERGYAPFNIQNLGGTLFITFAKQDAAKHDEVDGAGLGFVAAFTTEGRLLRVFQHGEWLNAPWGLALAPGDFGAFSHQLLVGNFGSGQIAAYNIETGKFQGVMLDAANKPISIDGLWGLGFGNGKTAGPLNTLYFSAGPNAEANGLFGTLTAVTAAFGNSN